MVDPCAVSVHRLTRPNRESVKRREAGGHSRYTTALGKGFNVEEKSGLEYGLQAGVSLYLLATPPTSKVLWGLSTRQTIR